MTNMTRRDFMTSCAASAAFLAAPGLYAGPGARLRFGLLSDAHVVTKPNPNAIQCCLTFEPALRYFESRKADAVLCCGDLTDFGTPTSLRRVGEIWDRVFPGGRRSDGAPVVNLFHFGDHDMGGYAHKYGWGPEESEDPAELKTPICDVDYAKLYEECFHLPFAPIMVRDVKGYRFLLANHPPHSKATACGCRIPGLAEFLAKNAPAGDRPFFYSQHRIPRGTLLDDELECCDIGETAKALEKYPNAIAFCGHGHKNCADERSLWQGAFTALHVPSINYCTTRPGYQNGYSKGDGSIEDFDKWNMPRANIFRAQQGLFATVYADRMVVERRDFHNGLPLGPDWVIPLPKANGRVSWAARAKTAGVPQFPKGAAVTVTEDRGKNRAKREFDRIGLRFPVVHAAGRTLRAAYYEVTATAGEKEIFRRKVLAPGIFWADEKDKGPVEFFCARTDIPEDLREKTVFSVRPMNDFGKGGRPLVCKLQA